MPYLCKRWHFSSFQASRAKFLWALHRAIKDAFFARALEGNQSLQIGQAIGTYDLGGFLAHAA